MLGLVHIPSTSEATDGKGIYTVFNIHINGSYHGSVRYSQLLTFHQELKAKYNTGSLDEFPGKFWFSSLSAQQLYERRVGLEHYLHSVCQDKVIGTSDTLKEFLIAIQKASSDIGEPWGTLEVYLVNGKSVSVKIGTYDRSDQVLEKVCKEIQLATPLTYYFGLFLEKEEKQGEEEEEEQTWTVIRPLTDYECPIPSLQAINKTSPHRVTIRKSFWDPVLLPELLEDRVAKNMMYIEALSSVTNGYWEMIPEVKKQLSSLQKKTQKKEYLEKVGTLLQFGFIQLEGLVLDHPTENTTGFVRVGKMEIASYITNRDGHTSKIFTYSLPKIRSWKVGAKASGESWMKFFYQMGPGDFIPVTVTGPYAAFLSNCLHSIVDEFIRIRNKQEIKKPSEEGISRVLQELPTVVFYQSPEPAVSEGQGDHTSSSSLDGGSDTPTSTITTTTTTSPSDSTPVKSKPHPQESGARPSSSKERVTSTSSIGERPTNTSKTKSESKAKPVKTSKKKGISICMSDIENPTFQFGTDDDL